MFYPENDLRIWLCTEPTDMRKSFRGLSALVKNTLQEDPTSGQLFVFINRRRTQLKILYFDRTGYCIWSKKLALDLLMIALKEPPMIGIMAPLFWADLQASNGGVFSRF